MPLQADANRVAAVILAAGTSSRMGTNKMLLEIDGEPLVRRSARRARGAGLSPIVVVVGHEADKVEAQLDGFTCQFAVNPDFTGPTSGSLHRGLEQLAPGVGAAVVILADMVHVTGEMMRALVDEARVSNAPLFVSRYKGVTAPPILFRRALFPELMAWEGDGCGKAVVQAHAAEAVYKDWPAEALMDVDTPEDFQGVRTPPV